MGRFKFSLIFSLFFFLFSPKSLLFSQQEDNLIPFNEWLSSSRLEFEYKAEYQEFTLKRKEGQRASFSVLLPYIYLEGEGFLKVDPIVRKGDEFFLPYDLYQILRNYFEGEEVVKPQITTIILDPGHGGKDRGTQATYSKNGKKVTIYEKEIVLEVSKRVKGYLKEVIGESVEILLTREEDVFLTLDERVEFANNKKPSFPNELIFVSIHANSSPFDKSVKGFEVWSLPDEIEREVAPLLDPNFKRNWEVLNSFLNLRYKTESRRLAEAISESYSQIFSKELNRGLKQESWFVVKNSYMPAVLVEVGFISSEEEAFLLIENEYVNSLAKAIAMGIKRFVDEYK